MTCGGCSGAKERIEEARAANRARAIICQTCIYAERSDATRFGLAVVSCRGLPIAEYITGLRACPEGKHPDRDGVVFWLGLRWFGVPGPLRLAVKPWLSGSVPGCGCVRILKLAWMAFRARFAPKQNTTR